ncbi:carbohydrate ABC transporter permease [Arthrobacter sp. CJ23]|uniref:carbohydrate ABC transporter permease n=1 Tax=Arthrobacter sp. CJ23 TaxID=2972479 RepID=UPI00215C98C8|nr:sugar ABC transporter permease [Arthrobacter sp. CJ23]UVJ39080.1 sugar ABC transporter permease [Arthrobacter sp. CJ23]
MTATTNTAAGLGRRSPRGSTAPRGKRPTQGIKADGPGDPSLRPRAGWRVKQDLKGASLSLPFLLGFGVFTLIPIAMALKESVFATKTSGLGFGKATSTFVGFENFAEALTDTSFWAGMLRVFLYAIIVVPLGQLVSLAMALVLDGVRRRVAARFRIVLLLPYMVPGLVATMIWIYLYSPVVGPLGDFFQLFGLDVNFFSGDTIWSSIGNLAIWGGIGFNMLIMYGSLQSIPHEIFEAARIDGASELRIALDIKVPFLRGSLVLTSLLAIIGTLQIFGEPLLFRAVTPETITKDFTPAMMIYNQAFQVGNVNYATALSIVLGVVVGIVSAIIYRFTNRIES